uniref:sodium-coupled monocarboxylate transporter 1-like isoform X1 n=1 Tax=Styela clava TaxID=7725 RepID=UPI001939A3E7|nr:sodium-coupled monocarboxylate transporter 1-like isoform X1 [Styela clava]
MESVKEQFQALDFAIFGAVFILSATVGILFGYKDRKSKSTDNYYFGGRKISPIPVAVSIAVSFVSAITVIGVPVEVYMFGTVFIWYNVSLLMTNAVALIYYIPVFHRLQLNSVYEYLELRFHPVLRKITSVMGMINTMFYLGLTVYIPSLALSAVTPMNLYLTIAITSATCTFYTTVGGMKAVIWTDVFQFLFMIVGTLSILIKGILVVGGFDIILSAAERGQRNNFLTLDPDPRIRSSAWSITFGFFFVTCYETVCNQIFIQRWLSCRTIKNSRIAVGVSIIPLILLSMISIASGIVMYAYYEGCDPLLSKNIYKIDQIMPRFAVDLFHDTPGMAGLFVAAAFCGTLSTVSSGVNALSSLLVMDFILPKFQNLTPRRKLIISKTASLFFGALVMLLAYLLSLSQSNVMQAVSSIVGFIGGPILGLFTMGIFMPWIDYKGSFGGLLLGLACTGWIGISAMVYSVGNSSALPLSTQACNITTLTNTTLDKVFTIYNTTLYTETTEKSSPSLFIAIYSISPFLYGVLGCTMTLVGAHVTSIFTGFSNPKNAKEKLFVPLIDNEILPEKMRIYFRFGVPLPQATKSGNNDIPPEEMKMLRTTEQKADMENFQQTLQPE